MLVQAIDKQTGSIMYQGVAKVDDVKALYGDSCKYIRVSNEVSTELLLNSNGIMWSK